GRRADAGDVGAAAPAARVPGRGEARERRSRRVAGPHAFAAVVVRARLVDPLDRGAAAHAALVQAGGAAHRGVSVLVAHVLALAAVHLARLAQPVHAGAVAHAALVGALQ